LQATIARLAAENRELKMQFEVKSDQRPTRADNISKLVLCLCILLALSSLLWFQKIPNWVGTALPVLFLIYLLPIKQSTSLILSYFGFKAKIESAEKSRDI